MTKEVGGLGEARRLPTEVRRWWIEEMRKEVEERNAEIEKARRGGK